MANFHTDNLTIASSGEGMLNVLRAFARNLSSRSAATGFKKNFESIGNVEELYRVVQPAIDSWYWLAFTPSKGAPGDAAAACKSGTEELSETAGVTLFKRGSLYVLQIVYATPWRSNRGEVRLFARSLPAGDYGFGFLDADEYDGYEKVTALAARGTDEVRWGVVRDEAIGRASLRSELEGLAKAWVPGEGDDLAAIAFNAAVCGWTEYGTSEDTDCSGLRDALAALGGNPMAMHFEVVSERRGGYAGGGGDSAYEWARSSRADELVDECLCMFTEFPLYLAVPNGNFAEGMPSDALVAGDRVEMLMRFADSGTQGEVRLEVRSRSVRVGTVGYVLKKSDGSWLVAQPALVRSLALLTPFLSTSIESVTPKSHWRGRPSSIPPKLVLKVELSLVDLPALIDRVRQRIDFIIARGGDKGGVSW